MADTNWNTIFGELFKASQNQYGAKDDIKMNIVCNKSKCEEKLDELWRMIGKENPQKISKYKEQVKKIKDSGCRVLRNSVGKHKIVIE